MDLYNNGSLPGMQSPENPGAYQNGSYSYRDPNRGSVPYRNGSYSAYDAYPNAGVNSGGNPAPQAPRISAGNTNAAGQIRSNYSVNQPGANRAAQGQPAQPARERSAYYNQEKASAQKPNAPKASPSGGSSASSTKINYKASGSGSGGSSSKGGSSKSGGNSGNGSSQKKPSGKNKSFKQRFLAWLKRFLRSLYLMEKPMKIFLASASGFVLICIVVIFAVSGNRHKKAEELTAALALATPVPTVVAATATPEPTPEPTEEPLIQKGAEGEDVLALQKRLMELGYLAIDEPTSYYGHATKEAVKLFQRQHELQQDGICGTETIAMIYDEEAKPYVMTEGAEGDDIESFQDQLVELGYLESNQVTGYYGTDTVEAVTKFQNRNHLTKDGKAGEQTLEAINSPDARVSYTKEQEIIAEKKKQAALARASSAEGRIDKMISIAKKQLGDTYILGKSGPDSFDCSGLVYYCLRQVNVYTRRLNAAGLSKTTSWTKISDIDNVQRGDLLFFKSDDSSSIGHVGIYIGSGEMIDASSANGKVVRRGAKTSYWRRNFVVARRPIE